MAIIDLFEMPQTGPLLGIDPGSKTIGIAGSDGLRLIASPLQTLAKGKTAKSALAELIRIYDARGAVGLIIGWPLNMNASEGPRTQSARALAKNILAMRDIPIAFQDERLTSAEAERAMIAADLSRSRRAQIIDASAAALILQTALDRLANQAG